MLSRLARRFAWLRGTALGRDVVPLVCSSRATSPGCAGSCGCPLACWTLKPWVRASSSAFGSPAQAGNAMLDGWLAAAAAAAGLDYILALDSRVVVGAWVL